MMSLHQIFKTPHPGEQILDASPLDIFPADPQAFNDTPTASFVTVITQKWIYVLK